jgi:hypothetical protein
MPLVRVVQAIKLIPGRPKRGSGRTAFAEGIYSV